MAIRGPRSGAGFAKAIPRSTPLLATAGLSAISALSHGLERLAIVSKLRSGEGRAGLPSIYRAHFDKALVSLSLRRTMALQSQSFSDARIEALPLPAGGRAAKAESVLLGLLA